MKGEIYDILWMKNMSGVYDFKTDIPSAEGSNVQIKHGTIIFIM